MKRDSKQVLTELLVLKAQGGDEPAFTQLYETWAKDFLRLACFVVRDAQAAEEIAQESWVSVSKGLRHLEDPALFCAWSFRIVRRRCVDWVRKRKTERRGMDALRRASEACGRSGPSVQPETAVLSEAIQKLDTESRLLIHLFYEAGLSVAEAAVALEVPVGTVKSRLFALREKLKTEIERTLL